MDLTCPTCRHVVEVEPGKSTKCRNCGDTITAPETAGAIDGSGLIDGESAATPRTPASSRATLDPTAASRLHGPATPMVHRDDAVTRPASIASFVFGMLVFIPFVTQLASIAVGLYAVARPRRPKERVILAWAGVVLSIIALPCWIHLVHMLLTTARSLGSTAVPVYVDAEGDRSFATGELMTRMERIHRAAAAYRRDYGQWPRDVEVLVGRSLPLGFAMPPELTYRPPPGSPSGTMPPDDWILIASDELEYSVEGERMRALHRLICRLGGKVELLPSPEVRALLDAQSAAKTPAEPAVPQTGFNP